jgi:hypothetical protein
LPSTAILLATRQAEFFDHPTVDLEYSAVCFRLPTVFIDQTAAFFEHPTLYVD